MVCGWCLGVVLFLLFWLWFFFCFLNKFIQDCSLCLQGSDLLYEVEVPGPPTVLALSDGNGGNKILNTHIIK